MNLSSFIQVILIFLPLFSFSQTDFCKGFDEGYKQGYCHGNFGCVAPVSPACPVPDIGEDNYKGGYNAGFIVGRKGKSNSGGAYGQLKPIRNEVGKIVLNYAINERRAKENARVRRTNTKSLFAEYMDKAFEEYKEGDYAGCVDYYKLSQGLGWYDSTLELAAGISYGMLWKKHKVNDPKYAKKKLKQAYKALKLSKKHNNEMAKEAIKKLKQAVKDFKKHKK